MSECKQLIKTGEYTGESGISPDIYFPSDLDVSLPERLIPSPSISQINIRWRCKNTDIFSDQKIISLESGGDVSDESYNSAHSDQYKIIYCDTEHELIEKFCEMVSLLGPDPIIGYNCEDPISDEESSSIVDID